MTDHELDSLREKRKRELLAQNLKRDLAQKKLEDEYKKEKEREIRAGTIVNKVLEVEAITYMNWLSQNNPPVAQQIKDTIIMLIYKDMLKKSLSKIDIMRIERQIVGKESVIKVKRRGQEAENLNESMKKGSK